MPAPDAAFVPLGVWLRGESSAVAPAHAIAASRDVAPAPEMPGAANAGTLPDIATEPEVSGSPASTSLVALERDGDDADGAYLPAMAARDARLFRAHLADAFDAARIALVRELAFAVLGRELLLAQPDLDAIAARVLAEHPRAQCLRLRVAPGEKSAVHADIPVETDERLAPGDAVLELAAGTVDARLGVRLAVVLAAWS
jgi:hypothetical protein